MILQSKRVWIGGQFMEAQLEVEDGKIVRILPWGEKTADEDYGEKRLVPGFIDVHTHGAYGFDTNDGEPGGLRDWMRRIPEEGVTAILPTTVTQMPDVLSKAVANVARVVAVSYTHLDVYTRQVREYPRSAGSDFRRRDSRKGDRDHPFRRTRIRSG